MSRPGDWNCRSCQHLNFQRRDSCHRCGEAKYGLITTGPGVSAFALTGPDVRPGDWYCTCRALNFASRSSCFKCSASKDTSSARVDTEMSRMSGSGSAPGGATTSRSAWRSGDWICCSPGCNEHNFASRIECYRCNTPRDLSASKSSPMD